MYDLNDTKWIPPPIAVKEYQRNQIIAWERPDGVPHNLTTSGEAFTLPLSAFSTNRLILSQQWSVGGKGICQHEKSIEYGLTV